MPRRIPNAKSTKTAGPMPIGWTAPHLRSAGPVAGVASAMPEHELVVVQVRNTGRWIAGAAMVLVAMWLGWSVANNPNFEWNVVFQYLFAPIVLAGVGVTLSLTAAAMTIGIGLGIIIAVMRMSPNQFLSMPAALYLWFFRGTPVLVQLIFWYNLAILIPVVSIGIPFGPTFFHGSANDLITPYTAALLGLGLNEGAYMAEIVRAGILSIDAGQQEAARALGMKPMRILRRIVLPQAVRVIAPPTGNETIGMLKTTSLVSVIALSDLLYSVQTVSSRTFQIIPLLLVACLWYLAMTTVLSLIQGRIEKRLGPNRQLPARSWWFFGALGRTVR